MGERERPYDRYRRDRRHDLRVVLLTRWEMQAAREALGEAVKQLPNPPKSVKQMASYSAMEELKDAPCARIAAEEKAELVEAVMGEREMNRDAFEAWVDRLHPRDQPSAEVKRWMYSAFVECQLIAEQREAELVEMLRIARCPDTNCDNEGTTVGTGTEILQDSEGNPYPSPCPEPAPCQWCHERDALLAKHKEKP